MAGANDMLGLYPVIDDHDSNGLSKSKRPPFNERLLSGHRGCIVFKGLTEDPAGARRIFRQR